MTDTTGSTSTNSVPSDATQQALAGAFTAIRSANKAISLQGTMPKIDITGLEDVNQSLATAQAHATTYSSTISANIQNQLQAIIDYNTLESALASSIDSAIAEIKAATAANPPSDAAMNNLAAELAALQGQVQTNLYGTGGTADNPKDESALGVYNQLVTYQADVSSDSSTFKGYSDIAYSSTTGISADIQQKNDDIEAEQKAMANDRTMIGGGAAMIVTGALIIVVAVALVPETGGASAVVIGSIGVGAVAGGAIMIGEASADLNKKEQMVADNLTAIANDQSELASLTAINTGSSNVSQHADEIYGALDTIKTSWEQMDNDMSSTISALNLPQDELMTWITNESGDSNPSYFVMGTILEAQFTAPQADWVQAAATAQTILTAFANTVEFTMPDGTVPTQAAIAAGAVSA